MTSKSWTLAPITATSFRVTKGVYSLLQGSVQFLNDCNGLLSCMVTYAWISCDTTAFSSCEPRHILFQCRFVNGPECLLIIGIRSITGKRQMTLINFILSAWLHTDVRSGIFHSSLSTCIALLFFATVLRLIFLPLHLNIRTPTITHKSVVSSGFVYFIFNWLSVLASSLPTIRIATVTNVATAYRKMHSCTSDIKGRNIVCHVTGLNIARSTRLSWWDRFICLSRLSRNVCRP